MKIDASNLYYKELNDEIKKAESKVEINNCYGQRFIGSGASDKEIVINGTPGNALGCYLDGAKIVVNGNVQDAVGDTMNEGEIIAHGNAGDALGYAMRGGKIFIKGYAGYRTGIHMKEYKEKKPVIVVGGSAGSFLGEYMAGGIIIVLGIDSKEPIVGNFTGTGMHGGKIFLRCSESPRNLPGQVAVSKATDEDLEEIKEYISEYAKVFSFDEKELLKGDFIVLKPNAKNPYKQLYTAN